MGNTSMNKTVREQLIVLNESLSWVGLIVITLVAILSIIAHYGVLIVGIFTSIINDIGRWYRDSYSIYILISFSAICSITSLILGKAVNNISSGSNSKHIDCS
jgi:hypothetical protein